MGKEEEEEEEFMDFTSKSEAEREKEKIAYKNKVVFLRKSKKGEHLYAFDNNGALALAESIVMNISDVQALIDGKYESIKVSIMEKEPKDDLAESR
jgi:hypothetical protein